MRELLADSGVAQADLVIAPDNSAQIDAILTGVGPETLVLNIFAVKDESYLTHRNVVQTNIPHDAMYAKAIDAFVENLPTVCRCSSAVAAARLTRSPLWPR